MEDSQEKVSEPQKPRKNSDQASLADQISLLQEIQPANRIDSELSLDPASSSAVRLHRASFFLGSWTNKHFCGRSLQQRECRGPLGCIRGVVDLWRGRRG